MELKEAAYSFCKAFVSERLTRIQKQIVDINISLTSESKSTAGDKHETGRAMLQLEREKLGMQLQEAEKMQLVLNKVSLDRTFKSIALGSLVKTNVATYFMAISAGKYSNGKATVFCISTVTPIGKLLMGKSVKDAIMFNGKAQEIIAVL